MTQGMGTPQTDTGCSQTQPEQRQLEQKEDALLSIMHYNLVKVNCCWRW